MQVIRASLSEVIVKLNDAKDALVKERNDSEDAHSDWEDDEDQGDEPDIIDNDEEITKIDRALNFLEKAVDELDD